jgi:iron complex outermembrane recepter protein
MNNVVRGVNFDGKIMSGAPKFVANAELQYKPSYVKGLRLSAEWQHQSRYYLDDLNLYSYRGFDVINLRVAYKIKSIELWCNMLNATNLYYAVYASKNATTNGSAAYAYNLGDPRETTLGIAWHFSKSSTH